jgi:hypothetical protein
MGRSGRRPGPAGRGALPDPAFSCWGIINTHGWRRLSDWNGGLLALVFTYVLQDFLFRSDNDWRFDYDRARIETRQDSSLQSFWSMHAAQILHLASFALMAILALSTLAISRLSLLLLAVTTNLINKHNHRGMHACIWKTPTRFCLDLARGCVGHLVRVKSTNARVG